MSILFESPVFKAYREGRHLVVEYKLPAVTLGTSFVNGGQTKGLRYLVNHQCVEGKNHKKVGDKIQAMGQEAYHKEICHNLSIPPSETAIMSTAASMLQCAVKSLTYKELEVTAIVTAGVQGNAGRAGDPATWHEEDEAWEKLHSEAGTINTMLLINWPLSAAAHSRCLITATEAKTAALLDLAIPGKYSSDLATGTGTDQILIGALKDDQKNPKNWSGKHSKLGELIGKTVLEATKESLRWQNGLEPSYTRSLSHALSRFGFREDKLKSYLKGQVNQDDYELYLNNDKALLFDPQISGCAFALAGVMDRCLKDSFPETAQKSILTSHLALLSVQVSGKKDRYKEFYNELNKQNIPFVEEVYHALSLGWKDKWI